MGQIIYYLTRYYSSTGSAAAALIVSNKQPPLSLSVSNYAIIGFLLSSTQLCKTLDFCYHGSVTHAGISPYGRVKYARILDMPPSRCMHAWCMRACVAAFVIDTIYELTRRRRPAAARRALSKSARILHGRKTRYRHGLPTHYNKNPMFCIIAYSPSKKLSLVQNSICMNLAGLNLWIFYR